jgi:hypothetical protein
MIEPDRRCAMNDMRRFSNDSLAVFCRQAEMIKPNVASHGVNPLACIGNAVLRSDFIGDRVCASRCACIRFGADKKRNGGIRKFFEKPWQEISAD